jgi:hypothetical protein
MDTNRDRKEKMRLTSIPDASGLANKSITVAEADGARKTHHHECTTTAIND